MLTACTVSVCVQSYTDGGFTDNLPVLPVGRTITVSPMAGKEDICPRDPVANGKYLYVKDQRVHMNKKNFVRSLHAFVPPKHAKLEGYYAQGLVDAERVLLQLGFFEDGVVGEDTLVCIKEDEDGTQWYCSQL